MKKIIRLRIGISEIDEILALGILYFISLEFLRF
jgi:hypothetical protein